MNTKPIKQFIRDKYAWPGEYPMALLMLDGECLCHQCAKDNAKLILRATRRGFERDWVAVCPFINWEDQDLICTHCDQPIEAAYAP